MDERIELNLAGRRALLTGAGRGIGLAIARALVAHGAAVAIQDIDLAAAREAAGEIAAAGGTAIALGGDLSDLDVGEGLVKDAVAQLGGLDVLVNNAGIQIRKPWIDNTREEILRQVNADALAPYLLSQHAARIFVEQRWGRILNIGSIQQKRPNPGMLPYSMSKAALEHMTRGMAFDLAKAGITVNLIAPGFFDTLRNEKQLADPERKERLTREMVPAGRIGEPRDCAGIAVFLCSEAASYITGQSIFVDGGMSSR